ncbi:unnamed protein product, partial [Urochloa humidicola]
GILDLGTGIVSVLCSFHREQGIFPQMPSISPISPGKNRWTPSESTVAVVDRSPQRPVAQVSPAMQADPRRWPELLLLWYAPVVAPIRLSSDQFGL